MLTSQMKIKVDIPHERGEWAEIRMLSWRQREEAKQARLDAYVAMMQHMGSDVIERMKSLTGEEENAARQETQGDPLAGYDKKTVLVAGLSRLSYCDVITPEVVEDLDEQTADFLAREIVGYSVRTVDEGKGSRKPSPTS